MGHSEEKKNPQREKRGITKVKTGEKYKEETQPQREAIHESPT